MPPPIALLLCTGFVLFLLRLDRLQSAGISVSLWIPTIWMLSTCSKPLASWFGAGGESMESGSPLDRNFQIALLCASFWILNTRPCKWGGLLRGQPWLLVLMGYMLVSVLWSEIPFISFKRWTRELVALSMALVVATDANPSVAISAILRRTTYILIPFSILLIKYYPTFGVQFGRWSGKLMWIGVTLQKNGLGLLCLLCSFFLIWTILARRARRVAPGCKYQTHSEIFLLVLSLWLLKGPPGAYSATAVGVLGIGLAALAWLLWLGRNGIQPSASIMSMGLVVIVAVGIATPFMGGSNLAGVTVALGRDETLTGRTEIWAGLLPEAMRYPILGWGFGGFWTTKMTEIHQENSAHSGYLDALLQQGFLGLLLLTAFVISSGLQALRVGVLDRDYANLWLCCLLMTVVHNISESSIGSFNSPLTAIILILMVCSPALTSERMGDRSAVGCGLSGVGAAAESNA